MSDHSHRVVKSMTTITAKRTTATATTTEGDHTKVVTVTAMTTIEQTMIMTGMTTTGMIGTTRGIHETIGGTLIEDRETIDGITTIVVETLLKPTRTTLFPTTSQGPTRLHMSQPTDHNLPHQMTAAITTTRLQLTISNVTNQVPMVPNAQPWTAKWHRP